MEKEISKKTKNLLSKVPTEFKARVENAVEIAKKYHSNEKRYEGTSMLGHLLDIAILTTEIGLDTSSTIASLLHEIDLKNEESDTIEKLFGKDISSILEKIWRIKKATETEETPNEIIVKYILSSSTDLRPVTIKILDTLSDMRSVKNIPKEMQKDALRKALHIYAVLAEYINLHEVKKEIEERAFEAYLPIEYGSITEKMQEVGAEEKTLEKYKKMLEKILKNLKFEKNIQGRVKCKYSIYNKLKKYEKEWKDPNIIKLNDLIGFRILTNTPEDCFLILEKLMDQGEMNYDEFEDYISHPKPNGYKAIQFPIKFPSVSDLTIEIQVLTKDMYYHNTYGEASHIAYKASLSRYAKPTNEYDWVEQIHKQFKVSKNERERRENIPIKCQIYKDEVFVFTPKGKILDLNRGDTVLDFAFKLHTEIGNCAIGAMINGKAAKLSTILQTDDVVEIKKDKDKKYQKIEALKNVNSDASKFKIRSQLSKYKRKG